MVIKILPVPSNKPDVSAQFASRKILRHSQSVSCPPDHRSEQHQLANSANLNQMCILTKGDLSRIYDNLERRQRDKDSIKQEMERKNELLQRSMQLTKNWPNTIAGDRERKLQMKKLRDKEAEERKKVLDLEEEKLAAERRREYIDKAKQERYYETDRVKTFHSSLLLTEVLKERELQIEMKKRIEEMRLASDNDELRRDQETLHEFDKAEKEKKEKKAKERADLAQFQLTQINRRKSRYVQEKQLDQQEGDEYKRLAEKSLADHMELERLKALKKQEVKQMYDKSIEQKQRIKQIEEQMDEEEDEDIRVYAEVKKRIARLRREKELQANQEKQEARDGLLGYLGSLQKRGEADDDAKIFRAETEKAAKEYREQQEKYDKRQQMLKSIDKHRLQTLKRHQSERQMEDREDAELRKRKAETDRLFLLYQHEKQRERGEYTNAVSQFQSKQAQERKDRERNLKASELDEMQFEKQVNENERQQYQEYTGRVMSYLEENGRNIFPLQRTVADEMKRFDEFGQGYKKTGTPRKEQEEKKPGSQEKVSVDETKKNLGFQWEIPQKNK
ncbi:unnamed protein product [Adineta steineri]|uniref:Trichohyalin-plectin-homology domain-containing protein n=1 Tax=Adineta steineri TaxID=433720 RepID=A0A819A2D2_9BILA|nr:unnamed protein product [Adineta steineri]CAF3778554.1 unnamed protein product [Adineta steineri]